MNRFNLYGDLLFESIKVVDNQPQYLAKHFSRLMKGAKLLSFETDNLTFATFTDEINNSIKKFYSEQTHARNMLRLRFVLYRDASGYYTPDSNQTNFYTEIFPYEPKELISPLRVGIYETHLKSPGALSNIKTGNALIFVLAGIQAKVFGLDDLLIKNSFGHIIEATSSNIFWCSNNQWYTPPLSDGCIGGIMREVFMEQHPVIEKHCLLKHLVDADEKVLTNAMQGMRNFLMID